MDGRTGGWGGRADGGRVAAISAKGVEGGGGDNFPDVFKCDILAGDESMI